MRAKYDFSGWATKNDIRCSDGRIIRRDAFKDCDGATVPLVWNHQHNEPSNVLGHALLENRDDGVYAYCSLNDTESGLSAKEFVKHGDVTSLSIYANKLQQRGGDVFHGQIREVSLVLAGANPGAYIDSIMMHGERSEEEAIIFNGDEDSIRLYHANEEPEEDDDDKEEGKDTMAGKEKSVKDVFDEMTDIQKAAVYAIVNQALEDNAVKHSDTDKDADPEEAPKEAPKAEPAKDDAKGKTVKEVFNTFTDKQKKVLYALISMALEQAKGGKAAAAAHAEFLDGFAHADGEETIGDVFNTLNEDQKTVAYALIGQALEDAKNKKGEDDEDDEDEDDESEGGTTMKHNVFDSNEEMNGEVLSHSEMEAIFSEARECGSLKKAVLSHGIDDIEYLFPDAQNIDGTPRTIDKRTEWVAKVMNNVHHTPFARIKSLFADIREEDARAKGYIKGNRKYEEVIVALKRITTPTTIYKKQAIDRDDYVDITDFDVVNFLKTEMRGKLDEEIARAILIGDGRSAASADKINEQNLRPIWTDDDLFTIKQTISVAANATADAKAKAWIRAAVKARKEYRGTGNPTMFTTEDMLADALLMEDTIGRRLYNTEAELVSALRVKEIVAVPDFENKTRIVSGVTHTLVGIMVNLADYNIGTDKRGPVSMFDDFDIDYNQMKYLMETRCSGAMTVPYGAVALEMVYSISLTVAPEDATNTILGKVVNTLQDDIVINDTSISGTLKYVTGYTGYSSVVSEQSGNYLALKFTAATGATTTIELTGGPRGAVTLDSDMNAVIRVTNKNTQKLKVISTKDNETVTRIFSLRLLTCEEA